ncbi:PLP-dependent aminotransferase family protein, partial [Jiangella asiatica]
VGAGTFVSAAAATVSPSSEPTGRDADGGLGPRPGWSFVPWRPDAQRPPVRFDFQVGVPDARLFPYDTWRRLVGHELRPGRTDGFYAHPAGLADLRAAIARYVGFARGVRADADDVVVTSGAQQALDLLARVLVAPGDVIAVEEPGYPPACDVFGAHGAQLVGVPGDDDGLDVSRLPDSARLVYVTPSHQFPLGTAMSLARRSALLAWAAAHDAAVVEDDYDSEYRFADRPLEPLHGLDVHGRVVYVGTFSKTLLPSLRIGYAVVPPALRSAMHAAKQLADGHSPVTTQAALARFMDEGLLARHIRRTARVYAPRRAAVVAALGDELADHLRLLPSAAGLHVCALLRSGDAGAADEVVAAAAASGVTVEPLAAYYREPPGRAGFVLGYGVIDTADVPEGLRRFGAALRAVLG